MLNRFIIQGRIVFEPKLQSAKETSYTNFRIAWNSKFKDSEGNKKTYFFNVTAFNKTAEFISKYFKKGETILIEGQLKDNEKKTELIANEVFFCGAKTDKQKSTPTTSDEDDDLPF